MNVENPENVKCLKCRCYRSEASFYNEKGRRLKTCQTCRDRDRVIRERRKCEHDKQKYQCIDCKGSSFCEHDRRRNICKDCGGTSICIHDRQRSKCRDCGGTSICEHDRQRNVCKDCEGSSFCEHDRRKNICKDCGGTSICEHDREKNRCKDCGGASICEHNKIRIRCKICYDPLKITIKNMLSDAKKSDKKYNRYDVVNFVDYCFVENLLEDYTHCYYEDCKKELQIIERNDSLATIERINNNLGHIKSNCVICCLHCNNGRKSRYTTE